MASRQPPEMVAFGPFRLHLKLRRLFRDEEEVRLGNRAMELLIALAGKKGEVVTKRDLFDAAWPGIFIEDGNLKVTIASLRRTLRKYSAAGDYIKTFSNRGYWLSDEAEGIASDEGNPQSIASTQIPHLGNVIGRADEIAELCKTVGIGRLTNIVGAGGIGKTTVAIAVARIVEGEEEVPVTFVDLSRITDEEYVIPSLAAVLGINSGSQDRLDAISSTLAKRATLLVLDTCEHVSNAVAHLCEVVLRRTESVRILCTSRQVLRAKHEKVVWLAPLGVPPAGAAPAAEEVLAYPAPKLLVERASEAGDYKLTDGEAGTVAEICRRLGGLPLAIELIAPRLLVEAAADVLRELDNRFAGFTGRELETPLRQRTLLATLEWSYAMLTESEAAVLRAASIFAQPFEPGALLRVISHHHFDPALVFDALAGLRSKSMLSIEHASDEMRFRLLDSTRAFAANLLEISGEVEQVSAAYARYVLEVFEKSITEQARLPAQKWYTTYATRAEELRKAITWALYQSGDTLLGLRLVVTGLPLWHELSMMEDARRNCEEALAAYDRISCSESALKLKLLLGLAAVTRFVSTDTDEAIATFEKAIKLSRDVGDKDAECQGLVALASYRLLPGYRTAAQETLAQLKNAAMQSGNRPALWEHETLLAEMDVIQSDYPAVIARLERLREQIRNASDGTASRFDADIRIRTENTLGAAQWLGSQRPGTGLRRVQTAAHWALEAHHGWTLIYCFTRGILFILSECRDYALGGHCLAKLREAIDRYEVPTWTPVAVCYAEAFDALSGSRRDPDAIMRAFDQLRTGLPQHGRHVYYALLTRALHEIGCVDEAARILNYVFEIGPQRSMLPELLRLKAIEERSKGRDDDAHLTLSRALAIAEDHGSWAWRLRAATDLASLLLEKFQVNDAKTVLEPVYGQFLDGFVTPDLQRANKVLDDLNSSDLMSTVGVAASR
ncbi:winged helix-turn-helix domain-containing protein [Rhizobium fabae]|uniref:Putative ATPase/DNA-binding winged helix-turn-helix (WHTH) protein n=1 Tax=Rhizobium fabae TaxID=573179 RepID=A0A7W6BCB9_9HYPH|nr:winged helix-turn-helix domain-containing protein [Rhizobium fabae]MBB3916247.1 putative ATPase/DNA-binding winged helix-turn-helix (wHTH) protein [Rhizobium fabae]RUM11233.1 hypothetical protein EFB14_20480 [Rhizobium fabae]